MASEYRDQALSTIVPNPTTTEQQEKIPPARRLYSDTITNNGFPKKDQAIIMESVDCIPLLDYANAIGILTGPTAIRFMSRISNARICIYLDSKKTATNLTDKYKHIQINNINIGIKPLLLPSQRIILSNVSPTIPHEAIEDIFKRNHVRITCKISFLRAGIQDPKFNHILSFRRQIFVNPEDVEKIPSSFVINHEETQYRIFTSPDMIKCFRCNEEGHISKQCQKADQEINTRPIVPVTKEVNIVPPPLK